jgi:hypothetical protein
MAVFADMPV